jgi:ABC-type lipoprotein release transport system permease subunit
MSDFILVLVAIFIVFGVFRRYLFFLVMNAVSKKLYKEMQKQQQGHSYAHQRNQEGKVNVDTSNKKQNKRINDDDGEYVDYVEIKD